MHPPTDITAFRDSLDRALADPGFFDRFYDSFISSSAEIEGIFRNVNLPSLKRKVKDSLRLVDQFINDEPGAAEYLELLGRTHRQLRIEPHHFAAWTNALIATVAQCDAEFGLETERVWRSVLDAAIRRMQETTTRQWHSAD